MNFYIKVNKLNFINKNKNISITLNLVRHDSEILKSEQTMYVYMDIELELVVDRKTSRISKLVISTVRLT